MKKGNFLLGFILGGLVFSGSTAVAAGLLAEPGWHQIFVDGKQVPMETYNINGNNYVKLRDIGKEVGFNVYWDSGNGYVQVESGTSYTGEAPQKNVEQEPVETPAMDAVLDEMIQRINDVRRENGAAELKVDPALMEAARICSSQKKTYHDTKFECLTVLQSGYLHGFGANLTVFTGAETAEIAERAVTNWVHSTGHFQTMISRDADSIGVGVYESGGVTYCYMLVGKPNSHNPYE